MLLPGRLHREAAGDELGPDLASHRGKAKALSSEIGVKADSWPPAGDGRPPMWSAGLMPKSNHLKKIPKCTALRSPIGVVAGSPSWRAG